MINTFRFEIDNIKDMFKEFFSNIGRRVFLTDYQIKIGDEILICIKDIEKNYIDTKEFDEDEESEIIKFLNKTKFTVTDIMEEHQYHLDLLEDERLVQLCVEKLSKVPKKHSKNK